MSRQNEHKRKKSSFTPEELIRKYHEEAPVDLKITMAIK